MKDVSDMILKAAISRCQAEIDDANAKISLYMTSPVGVGEHPGVVDEILTAAEQGASAKEKLQFLVDELPRAQFLKK